MKHNHLFSINVTHLESCVTLRDFALHCKVHAMSVWFSKLTALGTYHLVHLSGCQQFLSQRRDAEVPATNQSVMIDFHHASCSLGKLRKKKKEKRQAGLSRAV